MTKPKRKPSTRFHAFVVEPKPGFQPKNWRQNPEHYRIVEYAGPKLFKGNVDAWKFLLNHEEMQKTSIRRWAIYLDFDATIFGNQINGESSSAVATRGLNASSSLTLV